MTEEIELLINEIANRKTIKLKYIDGGIEATGRQLVRELARYYPYTLKRLFKDASTLRP